MNESPENQISIYLNSQSRNKIVFYKDYPFDFDPIDLGYLLAQSIYNLNNESKLSMKVTTELDKILNTAIKYHNIFGKILAISNIGILLEPDLKQDLNRLFEKHSINNVLFVKWDGEIENGNLYFLKKETGIKININNLSYITL